jgi:cytochrome b
LAAAFAVAYITEDHWLSLHVFAGYTVAGLLLFRLLWGFIGPRHARFGDFVRPPSVVLAYLRDIVTLRPRRYLGHNPAGGAMVLALLAALAGTVVFGLAVYGVQEFSGPLAAPLGGLSAWWGEALEEVHEFFANLTLLLVGLHLVGVAIASLQHRENLARAMLTGRKTVDSTH